MSLPKPYYQDDQATIYCADCREVLPEIEPESFECVWTDPPYGHGNQDGDLQEARVGIKGARTAPPEKIANDESFEHAGQALTECGRILVRDCCCCCCCCGGGGPTPTFAVFSQKLDEPPLQFFHAVVWDKTARGIGLGWRFRRDYEFVLCAHRRGGKFLWRSDTAISNVMRFAPVPNTMHPTTKPVDLVGRFLDHVQPVNVLDPFMGSGTTLVAAKLRGIKAVGIEIEEKYCAMAVERLRQGVLITA